MTLEQYIRALGDHHFFLNVGIPSSIMKTVERGEPIAESYAKKICAYLSKEFERPITIADIKGLKTC